MADDALAACPDAAAASLDIVRHRHTAGPFVHDQRLDNAHRLQSRLDELETELSELRRALAHQERLATLGTIAGLIAHEFNNILTPVMSYAQMALAAPEDRALAAKALQKASDGSERASQIAGAILGFVRDDNSAAWIKPSDNRDTDHVAPPRLSHSADVMDAVHDAISCMGRDLTKDLVTLKITGEVGVCVGIKPLALQHILLNLILNARAAMLPLGGVLTIDTRRTAGPLAPPEGAACSGDGSTWNIASERGAPADRRHLPADDSNPWAVIRVMDTGRGMRPDALARVFEAFYTTGGDAPEGDGKRRGTGLGMTMCKRLTDEVGGYLVVESAVGQGTCVSIVLPEAAQEPALRRSA